MVPSYHLSNGMCAFSQLVLRTRGEYVFEACERERCGTISILGQLGYFFWPHFQPQVTDPKTKATLVGEVSLVALHVIQACSTVGPCHTIYCWTRADATSRFALGTGATFALSVINRQHELTCMCTKKKLSCTSTYRRRLITRNKRKPGCKCGTCQHLLLLPCAFRLEQLATHQRPALSGTETERPRAWKVSLFETLGNMGSTT